MEQQGPFDRILQPEQLRRPDSAALVTVALAVVLGAILLVLILPPISILDDGGDTSGVSGTVQFDARDELPAPPDGYEPVSPLYDLTAPAGVASPARITVSLSTGVGEGDALVLSTYRDGEWRRLADAEAVAGGESASAELPVLPANVAVLRPLELARTVAGSLPAGTEIDPAAAGQLSVLHPGGLNLAADGSIAGDPPQRPEGVDAPVVPMIAVFGDEAVAGLAQALSSSDARARHVAAVRELVQTNGYDGVQLDYRALDPAQSADFTALVGELSQMLHDDGRTLSLVLPAPVRQGESWDELGFDWRGLAPLVDTITVAPVSPRDAYYPVMEEALGYITSRVSPSKVLLSVSTLSRERAPDGERALTLGDALAIASTPAVEAEGAIISGATVAARGVNLSPEAGATGLRWDAQTRAVTFTYAGPGGEHTVWLANRFSEAFKLDLAARYQLGGVAVEDVSRATEDAGVWPAVAQYASGDDVDLVAPNGELLQPRWLASGGTLDSETGPAVTWTAPAEAGAYTLTLVVSDGVIRVGQDVQLEVAGQGGGP